MLAVRTATQIVVAVAMTAAIALTQGPDADIGWRIRAGLQDAQKTAAQLLAQVKSGVAAQGEVKVQVGDTAAADPAAAAEVGISGQVQADAQAIAADLQVGDTAAADLQVGDTAAADPAAAALGAVSSQGQADVQAGATAGSQAGADLVLGELPVVDDVEVGAESALELGSSGSVQLGDREEDDAGLGLLLESVLDLSLRLGAGK